MLKKFNFNETYLLIEGFFDELENDLDDSDYVVNSITNLINNQILVKSLIDSISILYTDNFNNTKIKEHKLIPNKLTTIYDIKDKKYVFFSNYLLEVIFNASIDSITSFKHMFLNSKDLKSVKFIGYDTYNVVDMYGMFNGCESLTELDLSSFNTSNVTDMYCMFNGCKSLTELDLSSFNTSNVTDMHGMFNGCKSLTELDLSNFNTPKVDDMVRMFENCESLTELDLSSFDTSNVIDISYIFNGCKSLKILKLGKLFKLPRYCDDIFRECNSLEIIQCTNDTKQQLLELSYILLTSPNITWRII